MLIGSKILPFENLPSTNSHAIAILKDREVPEGTIIRASYQTTGRGQLGNYWESEKDKNLLISIILYPFMIEPEEQFLISMMASLGICDFLKRSLSDCKIKWPNDIYIKNDKIAGILIENSIMGNEILNSVVGIGLNINQLKFLSDAPNAVSMSLITGKEYDLSSCLSELAGALDKRYNQLKSSEHSEIRKDYLSQLYRLNEWCDFRNADHVFKGRILSVKNNGILQIEHLDLAVKEYLFKEVDFIL